MRAKLLALMLGCGLAAAAAVPALACPYQASSNDRPPQQTAQAQSTPADTR